MFNTGSRPTITKSVVESADSGIESADSTADSGQIWAESACGYGPLVYLQLHIVPSNVTRYKYLYKMGIGL